MTTSDEKRISESDRLRRRADCRGILPGVAGFLAALACATVFAPHGGSSARSVILWLSPMVFVLWLVLAAVKSFRRADEYQQRVQLVSMAVGFAAAMIAAGTCEILAAAPIPVHAGGWNAGGLVWFAGTVGWVGTLWFKSLRAR